MGKDFSRTIRVADQIQRSLAKLIQVEIADPRVGLVNINEVEVARDYSVARVYVTFINLESEKDREDSLSALNNAAGFLRAQLAKTLNARTTPRLMFVFDKAAEIGPKLDRLINNALQADRDHHTNGDQ